MWQPGIEIKYYSECISSASLTLTCCITEGMVHTCFIDTSDIIHALQSALSPILSGSSMLHHIKTRQYPRFLPGSVTHTYCYYGTLLLFLRKASASFHIPPHSTFLPRSTFALAPHSPSLHIRHRSTFPLTPPHSTSLHLTPYPSSLSQLVILLL